MCRDQWSSEPFVWQPLNEDFKLVPWVVEHFAWGKLSLSLHTAHTHKPLFPSPPPGPLLRLPLPSRLCDYISLMAVLTWYSSLSVTARLLSHCGHSAICLQGNSQLYSIGKRQLSFVVQHITIHSHKKLNGNVPQEDLNAHVLSLLFP